MSRAVITAKTLDDLRREGHEIRVPRDALITPAARDWLRHTAYPVTWLDAVSDSGRTQGQLGVAADFTQPSLRAWRTELERIAGEVCAFEMSGRLRSRLAAVRRLCATVQRGALPRGLVLASNGAVSACVANKFRGIRACVAVDVSGTEEAVRELGLNILVIEYPTCTFHEFRQMLRRLIAGRGYPEETVSQALAGAEASEG